MKLSSYLLCLCSLCFSTYAFSEEADVPATEEVAVEAEPAMEEKAEEVIETTEEKVEEVAAEAAESS
jgi:hypothetical protein